MADAPSFDKITPVILSGGAGTRLWPLSRAALPKQMLDLTGGGTMLALTAARVDDAALFAPPSSSPARTRPMRSLAGDAAGSDR